MDVGNLIHHRPITALLVLRLFFFFTATLLLLQGVNGIRLDHVEVPAVVAVGETAHLSCDVDQQSDQIYSIKWYKDSDEFYEWKPKRTQPIQIYQVEGVQVDREKSIKDSVVLRSVTPATAGFYRCEASGEGPAFRSVSGGAAMTVVILPKKKPDIFGGLVGGGVEDPGDKATTDTIELNCTTDASRPAAFIRWFVDSVPVSSGLVLESSVSRTSSGLETSFSVLQLQPSRHNQLFPRSGPVTVTCEASIPYSNNPHLTGPIESPVEALSNSFQRRIAAPSDNLLQGGGLEKVFRSKQLATSQTLQSLTLRKDITIYVNGVGRRPTVANILTLLSTLLLLLVVHSTTSLSRL